MCLQTGRIDPDRLVRGVFGSQTDHDPGEDAVVAPALPAGLGRTVLPGRVAPPQAIAIDEYYADQNAPVVDAGLAMAFGKERPQPLHLRICQPKNITRRSGLLAKPESRKLTEIIGFRAWMARQVFLNAVAAMRR